MFERRSEKMPTAGTVSNFMKGSLAVDTVDIVARILSDMEFFEGLHKWCEWPARLEWRRTA